MPYAPCVAKDLAFVGKMWIHAPHMEHMGKNNWEELEELNHGDAHRSDDPMENYIYIYTPFSEFSSERWQEVRRLRWFAGISKCWKLFATCRNRTSCHCHRLCPVHRCHPWHPGSSEAPHPALRLWSLCPFHSLSIAFLSFARHLLGLGQCIPPICFLPFHWPSLLPCCQRGGPECHKITTPTRSPSSCMGNSWEWGGLSLGVPNNVINAFYLQLFELWVPRKIHWLWEWPQGGL